MRKVRMKTLAAGPNGVKLPGAVASFDDATVDRLVAGGFADEYVEPVENAGKGKPAETTSLGTEETAVKPKPKPKKRRRKNK